MNDRIIFYQQQTCNGEIESDWELINSLLIDELHGIDVLEEQNNLQSFHKPWSINGTEDILVVGPTSTSIKNEEDITDGHTIVNQDTKAQNSIVCQICKDEYECRHKNYVDTSGMLQPIDVFRDTLVVNPSSISDKKEETRAKTVINQYVETKNRVMCPICRDGDAGIHKHYGGKACVSCRAFFRRAVQNEAFNTFVCMNIGTNLNSKCDINSKSWRSCRYCRFQLCIASGLKISLVLRSNPRNHRKFKHTNQYLINDKKSAKKLYLTKMDSNPMTNVSFANEEAIQISSVVDRFLNEYLMRKTSYFLATNLDCLDTLLRLSFGKNPEITIVDVANKQIYGNWWQNMFKQFILATQSNYNALDPATIDILCRYNMTSAYFLYSTLSIGNYIVPSPLKEILESVCKKQKHLSQFLPHKTSVTEQQNLFMDQHNPEDNYDNAITFMATRAFAYNTKENSTVKSLHYNQVYPSSIWTCETKKWKNMFRQNIHDIARWPTFYSKLNDRSPNKQNKSKLIRISTNKTKRQPSAVELHVDYVLLYLLSMVELYSTDRCQGLKEISNVERLQNQYLMLLQKYLKYRYPQEAYTRLARGMSVISKARESCDMLKMFKSWLSP